MIACVPALEYTYYSNDPARKTDSTDLRCHHYLGEVWPRVFVLFGNQRRCWNTYMWMQTCAGSGVHVNDDGPMISGRSENESK